MPGRLFTFCDIPRSEPNHPLIPKKRMAYLGQIRRVPLLKLFESPLVGLCDTGREDVMVTSGDSGIRRLERTIAFAFSYWNSMMDSSLGPGFCL